MLTQTDTGTLDGGEWEESERMNVHKADVW